MELAIFLGMTLLQRKRAQQQRGFSLMEILIVTSITLCVAGYAVPKMTVAMADLELRGAIHSASGIMQQTRMQAIKADKFYKTKYANITNEGGVVFADLNDNGSPDATEPQAQMGNTVLAYSAPTGIASLTSTDLSFTPVTATSVTFSPTGQPCSSTTTCGIGMVVYFNDTRKVGNPGWGAVSISPAGRVACWMWDGAAWQQQ
jgi:prepilin-type N-terminal cleavage/methylation domain-containing protein